MATAKQNAEYIAAKAALEFYIDHGVDVAVNDDTIDRTATQELPPPINAIENAQNASPEPASYAAAAASAPPPPPLGKNDARIKAVEHAQSAVSLEALEQAIKDFDGLSLKKTATNLVFSDGNPNSKIMLIGEAPGAEEDRGGKPFMGANGALLDKILACIDISRDDEDITKSVYLSTILNWRPPGNRTPAPAEIEVSLPFIERHIQLVKPSLIILCGGVPAKALLGSGDSISRLRKTWHDYTPQTPELAAIDNTPIPAIVTYNPEYLLRTPAQKRSTWADMLMLNEKRKALNLQS